MFNLSNIHLALLSLLALWTLRIIWRRFQYQRRDIQKLPIAPTKCSWIWGHELEIFQHQACEMYIKWAASLEPVSIYRIKAAFFQPDIVVVNDIVAVQHIFQNSYSYVKAPAFRPIIERLLGKSIVSAEGEDHKHQRRLLAPAFTSNSVKEMTEDIFVCVNKMNQKLRIALNSSGRKDSIIDIGPFISACTLDIIGRVAFGHDFRGGESKEAKEIASAWHEDVLMSSTFAGFLVPKLINLFSWSTFLPIALLPRESVSKRIVDRLAGQLLQENHVNLGTYGPNILSRLVNDIQNIGKLEGRLSRTQLLDNITTMMVVGHETSASTLKFTLLELARNPMVQQKLRQEVQTAGHLDHDRIQQLEYLDAVVKEGLRLYPAAPLTERVALQDDVIPLENPLEINGDVLTLLPIKANQVFHISFTSLNVNPKMWGPNAAQFVPERWIEIGGVPSIEKLPHGPLAGLSTFCDGPRSCLGYRLAVLELKIVIATVVQSFELNDTGVGIKQYIWTTLQPSVEGEAAVSMPLKMSRIPCYSN